MSKFFGRRLASLVFAIAVGSIAILPALADGHDHDHDGGVKTAAANVKHVFVIVLENKNFSNTFGTSTQDPYLQKTLVPMGGLLTQ
jgi:phosphatidylinositol-3-phosphatase